MRELVCVCVYVSFQYNRKFVSFNLVVKHIGRMFVDFGKRKTNPEHHQLFGETEREKAGCNLIDFMILGTCELLERSTSSMSFSCAEFISMLFFSSLFICCDNIFLN